MEANLSASNLAGAAEGQRLNAQLTRLYQEGKYEEAVPIARQLVALAKKVLGPDHPDVATSLNNLAEIYSAQGQYAMALPLYEQALSIVKKALGHDHPNFALSLNNLAGLYHARGQDVKAVPLYRQALSIWIA